MASVGIIGAGPAGSLAAVLLARAGCNVTLFEQQPFPRDKVCGECLSALGIAALQRAGLMDRIRTAGVVRLTRAAVWTTGGQSVQYELPRPMVGLSRAVLDTLLRDAAAAAGCTLCQPARCEHVEPGSRPLVRVRHLPGNRIETMAFDHVVIADGKGALGASAGPKLTGDLGIKSHFTGVDGPNDTIELFGLFGHYVGLAPVGDGLWNMAMSAPTSLVKQSGGDLDALLEQAMAQNAMLRRRLGSARRVVGWHTSPLPRFSVRRVWPAGVIPIGNAAAALEPIGGEGMGLAMRSAEVAAEHLLNGSPVRSLRRNYRTLWAARSLACRVAAMAASRPAVAEVIADVGQINPAIVQWLAGRMGKG